MIVVMRNLTFAVALLASSSAGAQVWNDGAAAGAPAWLVALALLTRARRIR
jgi:hypothetical protein